MTTLSDLAADLLKQSNASSGHEVTIADSNLGWIGTRFAQLCAQDLLRPAGNVILVIDPLDIPIDPPGNHFTVRVALPATAADGFFNLASTPGEAMFCDVGGRIEMQLRVDPGARWTLADSFPEVAGLLITRLGLQSAHFLFSTFTTQTGDPGWPATAGVTMSGDASIAGVFGPLADILKAAHLPPPPTLAVGGPVTQTPAGPDITLSASLGIPVIDLKVMKLRRSVLLAGVSWPFLTGLGDSPDSFLGFGGEVDIENAHGDTVAVDVRAMMPLVAGLPVVSVSILPATAFSTSLARLGGLLGGANWDGFFDGPAAVMKPFLSHFGLRYFTVDLATGNLSPLHWSLSVGTLAPWTVVPGKVVVEEFQVLFSHVGTGTTIGITADVVLFDRYEFTASIEVPDVRISAEFKGPVRLDVGQWLDRIAGEFDPSTPVPQPVVDALGAFTLADVRFSLDQPKGDIAFSLSGSWIVVGHELDFALAVDVRKDAQGYSYTISGNLMVGSMLFTGLFSRTAAATVFTARWSTDSPIGIDVLANSFGFEAPAIPPDLDLALKSAELVFDATHDIIVLAAASANYGAASFVAIKSATAGWRFFFGLDIDRTISLSDIPLVGEQLAKIQSVTIDRIEAMVASGDIAAAEAASIAALIDSGYPRPPDAGIARGAALGLDIDFGGTAKHLSVGVGPPAGQTGEPERGPVVLTEHWPGSLEAGPIVMGAAPGGDDGVTWFQVQKTFGPVTVQRIGVKYADQILSFAIDGSMSIGGLTVDLIGLTIGSPLSSFEPHFALQGLGIDYQSGPLTIGGGFLNVPAKPPVSWEYAGGVVVSAANFDIAAVGSYADVSGSPSMFIFGQLQGSLGGPPYFFVTGIMGGFGFNRSLRIPGQDEVFEFPLVRGLTEPDAVGGKAPTPLEVLARLEEGADGEKPWVTIDVGQSWIAAGIQFTSFEVVEGKVLAIVEFGQEFQLALIGLASSRFPQEGPEVYASVELQLEAVFKPQEGVLFFSAVLSPNSFVLSRSCKLTGGFAFELWFGASEHAGDFVVTVGGYSPYLVPARWYPAEPRVGFNWSLDSKVTISGEAYFALTPSAVMAGGALAVLFHDGNLKAWFNANADFIVFFKPFSFIADVGISVGASYKVDLWFTQKTFTVELGAELTLWGPPTGGTAKIHWWVISFSVDFGAGRNDQPGPLDWAGFASLLPKPDDVVRTNVAAGLAGMRKPDASLLALGIDPDADVWVVRAGDFRFASVSAIPASDLFVGSAATTPVATGKTLDIRPMQRTGLTSSTRVWLTHADGGEIDMQTAGWGIEPTTGNVPKALWGQGAATIGEASTDPLIHDQLDGMAFTAPPPALGPTPGPIDAATDLAFEPLPPGQNPLVGDPVPSGPSAVADDQSIGLIQNGIMATGTAASRAALFETLARSGWRPGRNGDLSALAADAGLYFTDPPMVAVGL